MTQPDRIETRVLSGKLPSLQVPGLVDAETAFADQKVLTAVNCNTRILAGETERRTAFLPFISVDKNGVAHCLDGQSGVETLLAAIAIDAQKTATLTRLELGPNQTLQFPISAGVPTRFGFFVGHLADGDISLAFRMGLYPGLPLVTETLTDARNREIYVGLRGIKSDETNEQHWSGQIELFTKLGFKPVTSRGVFNRFHRPDPETDDWKSYPLVALPEQMLGLLDHFDPEQVRINTFQMLYYATKDVVSRHVFLSVHDGHPGHDGCLDFEGYRGATRGGERMSSFGIERIGVGFGEAVSSRTQVKGIEVNSLVGAFEVIVTPK